MRGLKEKPVNAPYRKIGRATAFTVFVLGLLYAIITIIGLLSLQSPQDSIANPYFTIMEILTILIAPLMAISLVAVHYHAPVEKKFFSLVSVIFMFIAAGFFC